MKRIFFNGIYIVFGVLFIMVSCQKAEFQPSGKGDVLYIVKIIDSDTLFGLGLHAYSYDNFSSVKSYHEDDETVKYNLAPIDGQANDVSYETPESAMTTQMPALGDYIFNAVFPGGEVLSFNDELEEHYILPPVISKCEYNNTRDAVEIEWQQQDDAELYSIRLYNSANELLFISEPLTGDNTSYSFDEHTNYWQVTDRPGAGELVTIEFSVYIFETENGGDLNLQASGRIEKEINWGD